MPLPPRLLATRATVSSLLLLVASIHASAEYEYAISQNLGCKDPTLGDKIENIDLETCQSLCTATGDCNFITFNTRRRNCFLKATCGDAQPNNDDVIGRKVAGGVPPDSEASARCSVRDVAWRAHTIDNRWKGADGARTADVNGDGRPDIVVGWEQSGRVTMYLSPDYLPRDIGQAPDVEDAVFVDLDGDGVVDVVSASEGSTRSLNVHWAPAPSGDYTVASKWDDARLLDGSNGMREKWMYSLPFDVDGDGNVDLVVGGKDSGIWWLKAPESLSRRRDPGGWEQHEISPVGWLMNLFTEDIDGDGHLDLVVADRKGDMAGVRWLKHPGGDGTSRWRNYYMKDGISAMFMSDLVDVDGDGTRELVVPTENKRIYVLRPSDNVHDQWRDSQITHPRSSKSSGRRSKAIAVADIDGEGPLDLVASFEKAGNGASGILWSPDFGETWRDVSGPPGIKFDLNQLVDMDGDGDLDILNTEEGGSGQRDALGVVWYENPCR